jgi:RNA polymerase sigma factor (sigma-70 family)
MTAASPPPPEPFDAGRLLAEGRALRALARSLVGADADDVVQDGWVAALQRPAAARAHGAWLTGVVRNVGLRWRRTAARRAAREQRAAVAQAAAGNADAVDPANVAAQAETLHAVARAVHELDEPFRTVIVLRFWHDLATRDIAARLAVPHETVRSRLQRGIARLRERLDARPGGRAAWLGALGAFVPGKKAAGAAAPAALAAAAVTGMLMHTKLLLTGAALAAASMIVLWQRGPGTATAVGSHDAEAPATAETVAANEPARREAPAAVAATASANEPPADVVQPWRLRVLVVDTEGRPIDRATVRVWHGKPSARGGGGGYSGRGDVLCATLVTDVLGAAETTIDRFGVIAGAEHDGALSLEQFAWHTRADEPLLLPIGRTVALRGRVLQPDGTPAADAVVTPTARGTATTEPVTFVPALAPVRTGSDGGFELRAPRQCRYTLQATWNGAKSFAVERDTWRGTPPHTVLTFPGSITVRGIVVDPDGEPAPKAAVRLWRDDRAQHAPDEKNLYLRAATDGRFHADLQQHARYGLLATVEGEAPSDVTWIEPTAERPHVEVRLALRRFAPIAGVVRRPDGEPLAGALVHASSGPLDAAEGVHGPSHRERFRTGGEVTTDGDGRFALRVHPGTAWTVVVTPDAAARLHRLRRANVAPGTTDLTIVATDDEVRGCTITGAATRANGDPCPGGNAMLQYVDEGVVVAYGTPVTLQWDGERFRVPTLEVGRLVELSFEPADGSLAPQRLGPLRTVAGDLRVDMRLQARANVTVRVTQAGGTDGVRGLRVALTPDVPAGRSGFGSSPLEADGSVRLLGRHPGASTLSVIDPKRDADDPEQQILLRQPVTLAPGDNPDLVITLPSR